MGWSGDAKETMRKFLNDYNERGVDRYVYRLSEKETWKVVKKSGFKSIFNKEKNIEYFHISEWTG